MTTSSPPLAGPWREWLADNLVHGVPLAELAPPLVAQGVPLEQVHAEVSALRGSPLFAIAQAQAVAAARMAATLRLVRARADIGAIERRDLPGRDELYGRYWAAGIPFVAIDLVRRWPAFGRWSPAFFAERYGDVEIEASVGRDGDPDHDINFAAHARVTTMREWVAALRASGPSNDRYLIANNHNLARPGLRPLFDDMVLPDYLDPAKAPASAALWFGPAGTITRLHHDTSNILLCQVVGTKRVILGDVCDRGLVERARGKYSDLDPDAVLAATRPGARPRLHEIELAAGEALFLPVGWWHHVEAIEPSISVAFNGFDRPNDFTWFGPGSLGDPIRPTS